jgi:hypothetical protein
MPTTRTKPRPKAPRYKPHPMLEMETAAKEKIRRETGRSWDEWLTLARKHRPSDAKSLRSWLQKEHGFARMNAYWLAHEATTDELPDYGEPEPLVDALYSGSREPLRPLHESVVDAFLALGDDVIVTACKTMVPVYRKHVFAEMRPADGAVEMRLALGAVAANGRLEKTRSGMPGDRMTHRVLVRSTKDVDAELRGWLSKAYEQGAGKMARSTEFAMPPEFAKALRASKPAAATWETMTPAMRRDMVQWFDSAKQDETRKRRLATCVEKLAEGKKRVY